MAPWCIRPWLAGPSEPPTSLFGEPTTFDASELAAYELEPWVSALRWKDARWHRQDDQGFSVNGSTQAGWAWAMVQRDGYSRLDCHAGGELAGVPAVPIVLATAELTVANGRLVATRYSLAGVESPVELAAYVDRRGPGGIEHVGDQELLFSHQAPMQVNVLARAVADPLAGTDWANGWVRLGPEGWEAFFVYQDDGGWVHVRFTPDSERGDGVTP